MLERILDVFRYIVSDFPIVLLLLPYIGTGSFLLLMLLLVVSIDVQNPIRRFIVGIPDKMFLSVCVIALGIWVIFTTIFVFPFHCIKNWDQVKLIHKNNRSKK